MGAVGKKFNKKKYFFSPHRFQIFEFEVESLGSIGMELLSLKRGMVVW